MKCLVRLSGLILMISMMISCVTVQNAPPYTYTGDKPIYPAVYYAIVNGNPAAWRESKATVPDPNTVVIDHVQVSDGIRLADFTLKINLVNDVVRYQFSNIREKLPTEPNWTRIDQFSQSDREIIFTSYFNTEIPKVMENESLYAQAKELADKSLGIAVQAKEETGKSPEAALSYSLPLKNPQGYLLYPAVGAAFTEFKQGLGAKAANLRDIDCLDNRFTIQGCVAERKAFDIISYQIKIAYTNNQLAIEFTDIGPVDSVIIQYSAEELESLPGFDTQKIADQLQAFIERSLANADAYNTAKKAFLANNAFLNRALAPITKVLMDEFADTLFKDGEITLNATILDVKTNTNAEFSNYSTVISAGLYNNINISGAFALITLYTNDGTLTRLKQHENTALSGQFLRMEYSNIVTPSLIMTK